MSTRRSFLKTLAAVPLAIAVVREFHPATPDQARVYGTKSENGCRFLAVQFDGPVSVGDLVVYAPTGRVVRADALSLTTPICGVSTDTRKAGEMGWIQVYGPAPVRIVTR